MPRHDYNFPPDWEAYTDEQKAVWFIQERCRRQAMSQITGYAYKMRKQQKRYNRRVNARNTRFIGQKDH